MHSRSVQFNIVTECGRAHAQCTLSQTIPLAPTRIAVTSRYLEHSTALAHMGAPRERRRSVCDWRRQRFTASRVFNPVNVVATSHSFRNSVAIDKAFDSQCSECLRARSTCGARLYTECGDGRRPPPCSRPRPLREPPAPGPGLSYRATSSPRKDNAPFNARLLGITCVSRSCISGKFRTNLLYLLTIS